MRKIAFRRPGLETLTLTSSMNFCESNASMKREAFDSPVKVDSSVNDWEEPLETLAPTLSRAKSALEEALAAWHPAFK